MADRTRRPWSRSAAGPAPTTRGAVQQVTDLKELVVTYARQETVDPLKALGRHLGAGLGGAVLIGLGWFFGLLALLRGLQQIDVFVDPAEVNGGTFSWAPYFITALVGVVAAALYGRLVQVRLNENGVHGTENGARR